MGMRKKVHRLNNWTSGCPEISLSASIHLLYLDARFGVEFLVMSRGIADDETGRRGRKYSSASLEIGSNDYNR